MIAPTANARARAAAHDAATQVGDIAPQMRRMGRREDADFIDNLTHAVGTELFLIQFEAEKANTASPTPADIRRAVDMLPEGWMLDKDRQWSSGEGSTGIGGCDWQTKSPRAVEMFLTTEAGDLAYRITERRRAACLLRISQARDRGEHVNHADRQFRFPPSHFDPANPEHGSLITFTRKQIMDEVARRAEPQQMELAI